jgi:hypothetical protein
LVKTAMTSALGAMHMAAVVFSMVVANWTAALALPAVPPLKSQAPAPVATTQPASPPAPAPHAPPSKSSVVDALVNGNLLIDARYRYEHVEQTAFANNADAHTFRLRVGYQTGKVWDLQGLIEFEGIDHLNNRFNDTVNGKTGFPVVADPKDAQLNRLQLAYSGLPQTVVTVGRQRINLDNQRFVGGGAFRQNEQTFDAVRISNMSIPNLTVTYVYLNRVNRVFGEDSAEGVFKGDTHLLNVVYDIKDWARFTGYTYYFSLNSAPTQSTRTDGVRFAGRHDFAKGIGAIYAGEFARQSAGVHNPSTFGLDYWMAEGGVAVYGVKLLAGEESLAGDGTRGFATPLATLHKFQGYADVFLTTPANGINDRYGTLSYDTKLANFGPLTGIAAAATYHDFNAERGGASFGSEIDAELVTKLGKHWQTGVTYADYNGNGGFADRTKLWATIEFNY